MLILFLSILPPPPTSTLFPYTTLFRSYWGDRGTRPGQFNTPHSIVMDQNSNLYVADRQNSRVQVFDTDGKYRLDRKSTRLNSSHITISYAVFCLKKKNTYH